MAGFSEAQLLKVVKSGATHSEAANKLGVTIGQLPMLAFCKAQVEAGQFSTIPATAPSVKKARNEGNRWELIAARTGESVAKVKQLFGGEEAARKNYIGRGRNFSGSSAKAKPAANKGRQMAAKARGGAKTKARTRAERAQKSGNPS